jgi:hypothetical protein
MVAILVRNHFESPNTMDLVLEKNMANFEGFLAPPPVGQAEGSTLRVGIFLPKFFFT